MRDNQFTMTAYCTSRDITCESVNYGERHLDGSNCNYGLISEIIAR